MFWIEEFYSLEYRISSIDRQIVHTAQTSYLTNTENASEKIIELMSQKQKLINEYIEYKLEFDKMDPKKKAVFELRYKDNKTIKETAKQVKISARTICRWTNSVKENKNEV